MSLSKYQLHAMAKQLEEDNEVSAEIMSGEPTGWDLAEAWDGINHDDEPSPRKVLTPAVKKARLNKAKAAKKARRKNR